MRVEVVGGLAKRTEPGQAFSDSAVERAMKSFMGAVDSDDSLFRAQSDGVQLSSAGSESSCAATLGLKFRDEKLLGSRGAHFSLIEKLSGLLKQAGSGDALSAQLALEAVEGGAKPAFAVNLRLEARGSSPEQAGLRWGLGMAHVQQAVLFTSRVLRQELAGAHLRARES
jgi:hypothetical protein